MKILYKTGVHTLAPHVNLKHPAKQRGTALVLAMVMLTIMTLLAVTAMQNSNLQFLMAGNLQEQIRATISAENTLLTGQTYLVGSINSPLSSNPTLSASQGGLTGYYFYDTSTSSSGADYNPQLKNSSFWTDTNTIKVDINGQNRYVIVYIGNRPALGGSIGVGTPSTSTRNIYRVTARSTTDRSSMRMVQTIVVTEEAPS